MHGPLNVKNKYLSNGLRFDVLMVELPKIQFLTASDTVFLGQEGDSSLLLDPEEKGTTVIRNFRDYSANCTAVSRVRA
jgi:hypothetical protein